MIANSIENNIINIHSLVFNKQSTKWQFDEIHKNIQIDSTNYFYNNQNYENKTYLFTDKSNYLILSTKTFIKYINIYNQDIISEFKLPLDSDFDDFNLEIKTIPSSDDVILLYNCFKFIYIRFDNDYYTISSIERIYKNCIITEWQLTGSLLSFTLKTNQDTTQLLINSLIVDNETGVIEMKEMLKEKFELNSIEFYSITPNMDYLAVYKNSRVLSLFRIQDHKCIANVPMFSSVNCMLTTSQFIVMGINEKRVVYYLIADPQKNDVGYKIRHLESR